MKTLALKFCGVCIFLLFLYTEAKSQLQFEAQISGNSPIIDGVQFDGKNRIYISDGFFISVLDTNGKLIRSAQIIIAGNPQISHSLECVTKDGMLVLLNKNSQKLAVFADTLLNIKAYSSSFPVGSSLTSAADAGNGMVYVAQKNPEVFYKFKTKNAFLVRSFSPKSPAISGPPHFHVDVNGDILINYGVLTRLDTLGNTKQTVNIEHYSAHYFNDSSFVFGLYHRQEIREYSNSGVALKSIKIKPFGFCRSLNSPDIVFKTNHGSYLVFENLAPANSSGLAKMIYMFDANGNWTRTIGRAGFSKTNLNNHILDAPELLSINNKGELIVLGGLDLYTWDNSPVGPTGVSRGPAYTISKNFKIQNYLDLSSDNVQDLKYFNDQLFVGSGKFHIYDSSLTLIESRNHNLNVGDFTFDNAENVYWTEPRMPISSPVFVIYKNNKFGTFGTTMGSAGYNLGDGQVAHSSSIAMNSDGEFIVADLQQSQVHVIDYLGNYVRLQHVYGYKANDVCFPTAIAIDKFDNIFISEALNHRIKVTDKTGKLLFNFGQKGSELGQFNSPADIAIDNTRELLYVADRNNNRVQVFKIKYPLQRGLGIDDSEQISTIAYPNPIRDKLYLNHSQKIENIEILNLTGQLIYSNSNYLEDGIDTEQFENGFYLLRTVIGNKVNIQKIQILK